MSRTQVQTPEAPQPLAGAPYAQAVAWGELVFTSGQIPVDPETNELIEGDAATQTRQVLANVDAVLRAGGSGLDKVLKTTVFLADLADWPAMNDVYRELVGEALPARSAVQVGLPAGVKVEIEAVGHR